MARAVGRAQARAGGPRVCLAPTPDPRPLRVSANLGGGGIHRATCDSLRPALGEGLGVKTCRSPLPRAGEGLGVRAGS